MTNKNTNTGLPLTLDELASYLGMSPKTLKEQYVYTGKFRSVALPFNGGKKHFFPREWVQEDIMSIDLESEGLNE